jgi:hypothetical protein
MPTSQVPAEAWAIERSPAFYAFNREMPGHATLPDNPEPMES